jgi:hypothetical protein
MVHVTVEYLVTPMVIWMVALKENSWAEKLANLSVEQMVSLTVEM